MRIRHIFCFSLAAICVAWHEPHITITRAAIQSMPEAVYGLLASEAENIAQLYSFYPDRYRNASAAEKEYMRRFCALADGRQIHNVTWDKARDIESVEYLFESILASLRAGDASAMARYAGTLAHLLEDSLSPAHAMDLRLLQDLVPPPEHARNLYIHAPMELSCPDFTLQDRKPRRLGSTIPEAARAVIESCYAGIRRNRGDVVELLHAVYRNDLPVMDRLRLVAARSAAEQYADAMYTILLIARERGITDPPKSTLRKSRLISGMHVELSTRPDGANAARGAALNLAFALREAVRSLAIDRRVLRTDLGGVLIRVPAHAERTCVEMLGDWPPHSGSQVTELCLNASGSMDRVITKLDGVPDAGQEQHPLGEWIRTVDHRGDPLFELRANGGVLEIKNHRGVVASVTPSGKSLHDGAALNLEGAEPLTIHVIEGEERARVKIGGRQPETVPLENAAGH